MQEWLHFLENKRKKNSAKDGFNLSKWQTNCDIITGVEIIKLAPISQIAKNVQNFESNINKRKLD